MLFTMTEVLNRQMESVLADLLVRGEGDAVFLCDRGGNILTQSSASLYAREENIAALAAGSFYATRELARLIGEQEFHCVFHQGATSSVYMQSTEFDLLLLVVFGKESNPGLVRLYATEAGHALDHVVRTATGPEGAAMRPAGELFEIDETKQPFRQASKYGT